MLKIGKKYLVLEDLFYTQVDIIVEKGVTNNCFNGNYFSACFTAKDLLQIVKNFTDLLNNNECKIEKGNIIEILNVEYGSCGSLYHPDEKVYYVEFKRYFKEKPEDNDMMAYQNSFGWGYIREEFLKQIKKG